MIAYKNINTVAGSNIIYDIGIKYVQPLWVALDGKTYNIKSPVYHFPFTLPTPDNMQVLYDRRGYLKFPIEFDDGARIYFLFNTLL